MRLLVVRADHFAAASCAVLPLLFLGHPPDFLAETARSLGIPAFSLGLLLSSLFGAATAAVIWRRSPPTPLFAWSRQPVFLGCVCYLAYTYGRFPILVSYGLEAVDCAKDPTTGFVLVDSLVLAPAAEELVYRLIPLGLAMAHRSVRLAIPLLVLGSIIFGLTHQNHDAWGQLQVMTAGLVYGALYLRTGRVWVPVAAHSVDNLLVHTTEYGLHLAGYDWCS